MALIEPRPSIAKQSQFLDQERWTEQTTRRQDQAVQSKNAETKAFDIKEFNRNFEKYLVDRDRARKLAEKTRLDQYETTVTPEKKITEMTLGEILIKMKDSLFDLLRDLLTLKFNWDLFTQDDRLLYLGLLLLTFTIVIWIFSGFK